MIRRVMCVLVMGVFFQTGVFAAEPVSVQDRMVGGTFKTMARAYIAAVDIKKLKEKNITRIKSMREDWFKQQYARVYRVIRDLPPGLREKYHVTEGMSKAQAITVIRSLDKKQIYQIIDQVPDPLISQQVKSHFRHEAGETKDSLNNQVRVIWDKVVAAVNAPSHK